ncbi:MAG TPA: BlaI/MecI/CopY family transcriptional regulator [Bryobacteraceae bacterium]|jgi:predicted transcriptional regulator|nr:BlaI/MecI/CopY family transcriptional regulator [Bryobacteraceae bacterium]
MLHFFQSGENPNGMPALGPLEADVMDVLWNTSEANVRDVIQHLARPLAYTTVMTTLDRLYKKGLLTRRKSERAFIYAPRLSRQQWEEKRADDFFSAFLSGPDPSGEALISYLVDKVGKHDQALLDEMERKIKIKRAELSRREAR